MCSSDLGEDGGAHKHRGNDRTNLNGGESKQFQIGGEVDADEPVTKTAQRAGEDQSFGVGCCTRRKKHSELKHTWKRGNRGQGGFIID